MRGGIRAKRMKMQHDWAERCTRCEYIGEITQEEVDAHNTPEDRWIVLDGDVYNITQYISAHPGGKRCLIAPSANDITARFHAIHRGMDPSFLAKLKIGKLVKTKKKAEPEKKEEQK